MFIINMPARMNRRMQSLVSNHKIYKQIAILLLRRCFSIQVGPQTDMHIYINAFKNIHQYFIKCIMFSVILYNTMQLRLITHLRDQFVMIGKVCPAVDTAVCTMTLAGQVGLKCLHHGSGFLTGGFVDGLLRRLANTWLQQDDGHFGWSMLLTPAVTK